MKTIFTINIPKYLGLIFCLAFLFANTINAQTTATEDFETDAVGGGTFLESGINFTFNNGTTAAQKFDIVSIPGIGFGGSARFLEMYSIGTNSTATGTISINNSMNPGIGFKINSFAAYTAGGGSGTPALNGILRVYGTPMGGGPAVTAAIAISSGGGPLLAGQMRDGNSIVSGINFTGTALDGLFFTSLNFEIIDTDVPNGNIGTRYIELDQINFTTSVATTNTYAIAPTSFVEGNAGTTTNSYTITRSVSTATGTVQIQSSNGTATAGTDYVAVPLTTVNFPIGSLSQTVNLTINGDVNIEPNETISMNLSNPTVGTIAVSTATITILTDDNFGEAFEGETATASTFSEGGVNFQSTGKLRVFNPGSGMGFGAGGSLAFLGSTDTEPYATGNQGSIQVASAGKAISMLSVDLWSSDVVSNNFPPTNCTVTFVGTKTDGSGTVTHSANITPSGTNVYSTVNFAGTPFDGVSILNILFSVSSAANYLTIDNFNFAPINVGTQVSINDVGILEGTLGGGNTSAVFTVSRTNNTSTFSVNVASSNGTATAGSDYTAVPTTTLNFTNGGALSQTVTVTILKDAAIEGNETFNMSLSNATNGTLYLKQMGVGTIFNDDGNICETFDSEIRDATSFSENSINFSTSGRFKVGNSNTATGGGSNSSPGFLKATNGAIGSMGKIVLASPNKAFKLGSVDVWTSSNGTSFTPGSVTFVGTLYGGGGTVATAKVTSGTNWNQNILFTGTPLDNVLLTELEVISVSPITEVDIDNFCFSIFNTVPYIELADAGNVAITNGGAASLSNNTDFGTACVTGGTVSKTFTIKNTGAVNLTLTTLPLVVGGADASHFSITAQPSLPIIPGGSSTFTVVFDPSSSGVKNATISIANNDATNNPYVIIIKGTGIADPVFNTTTNNGLKFDGVNDFVVANYCSAQPIITGGSAITVEYWFKGSNIQSAVRSQVGNDYMVAGWSFPPKHILSNDDGTSGGVAVGAAATDGNWHHVAFTWQQNTTNGFKSYLDGELVQQRNSNNSPLPTINHPLYLGAFQGTSEFMNGSLDNVRIWNVARNQAQIQSGMCNLTLPQTGLVVFYSFDQGAANATNTGINLLENKANPANYTGVLTNFSLTGTNSNWAQGVIPNTLAAGPVTHVQNATTNPIFTDINCKALGKVEPAGASPVAGNVTFKSFLEPPSTLIFVQRHYEINPVNNPSGATANITLYFTQFDFDNFNSFNTFKLPQNPTDAAGIANIKIMKFAGTSAPNNDGQPGSYAGALTDISGNIISTIWNGQFWEIKFSTTSFSGFFISSASSNPLPVNLTSFNGKSTEKGNLLSWKTANEKNFSHFEIEGSPLTSEGGIEKFENIGEKPSNESGNYEYLDTSGGGGLYRLKMIDLDGKFSFSKIIAIENKTDKNVVGQFFPNPSQGKSFIEIITTESGIWNITTFSLTGKILNTENRILQKGYNKIEIGKLSDGINFVKFNNGKVLEIRKVLKE